MLDNSIKVKQDWGVSIISRVDASEYAVSLGYNGKDLCDVGNFFSSSLLKNGFAIAQVSFHSNEKLRCILTMRLPCAGCQLGPGIEL
jgi:hypothetical protein